MAEHKGDPIQTFEGYALGAQSDSEIEFYLNNSLSIDRPYIECRETLVYYNGDFGFYLSSLHETHPYTIKRINNNIMAYQLSRSNGNSREPDEGIFIVLKGSHACLFRVITVSRGNFWAKVIKPFLRHQYPHLSIPYFKQSELEEALLDYEKKLIYQFADKVRVSVIEVTRKSEQSSGTIRRVKFISTERSWTNLSFGETFTDLEERGFWFTNLKFRVYLSSPSKERFFRRATIKISKSGSFSCTGMYQTMRTFLIEPLEDVIAKRMRLLEGRGIIERDYEPGPPLEIVYKDVVFDSPVKVRQFGEVLAHYKNASIVVYHGNPYFHANIADQSDGSSFEIWVLSQSRILLSPQAKASAQALSRMINFIFDRFKEGVVNEFAPGAE